jgi:hypothetical protein
MAPGASCSQGLARFFLGIEDDQLRNISGERKGGGVAMSFSYSPGVAPDPVTIARLLISDTNPAQYVFSDQEIQSAYYVQASCWQSSMFYSGPAGQSLPYQPLSYLRVAALLLDSMAANKAYLSSIKSLPDVKLDSSDAAKMLMQKAEGYRNVEDNSGAFLIIEQCCTTFATRDRYYNQIARQTGIGGGG